MTETYSEIESPVETLKQLVRTHEAIRINMSVLTEKKDTLRKEIDALVDKYGEESSNGSRVIDLDDSETGVSKVTRQRRVSQSFSNSIASEVLERKGLLERCSKPVFVLDEQEVMVAYNEGLLTDEDLAEMFPSKVTWATIIK